MQAKKLRHFNVRTLSVPPVQEIVQAYSKKEAEEAFLWKHYLPPNQRVITYLMPQIHPLNKRSAATHMASEAITQRMRLLRRGKKGRWLFWQEATPQGKRGRWSQISNCFAEKLQFEPPQRFVALKGGMTNEI